MSHGFSRAYASLLGVVSADSFAAMEAHGQPMEAAQLLKGGWGGVGKRVGSAVEFVHGLPAEAAAQLLKGDWGAGEWEWGGQFNGWKHTGSLSCEGRHWHL